MSKLEYIKIDDNYINIKDFKLNKVLNILCNVDNLNKKENRYSKCVKTTFRLYGVDFIFIDNTLNSIFIMDSNDNYTDKIVFVDNNGVEKGIHSEYNLMNLLFEDMKSYNGKRNITYSKIIYTYDNLECSVTKNNNRTTVYYKICENTIIDNLIDNIKLKNIL